MAKSKKKVLDELARVRFIGPAVAKALYDDHGLRSISDVVEFGEDGNLPKLKGVGEKKAATILSSAQHLLASDDGDTAGDSDANAGDSSVEDSDARADESGDDEASKDSVPEAGDNGAARPSTASPTRDSRSTNGRVPEPQPSAPAAAASDAGSSHRKSSSRSAQVRTASTGRTPFESSDKRSLRQRFISTLRCPACGHDRFDIGVSTLTCQACQRQFDLDNDIADLAPPASIDRSVTQKVMESRLYTQVYEEFMRPKLTSLVSSRTMRDEYKLAAEFLDFDGDIRLLDVGCGTANFTRYFAQRIGLAETRATQPGLPLVVGMDLSWPMLVNGHHNLRQENLDGKVFLLRGDAVRIPVQRGAFNRLHCGGSLHMMSDIDESLRNFARVLEPDGICVIGTFILGKGILRRLFKRLAEFPTRFHWFSRDELHRRIERAGFEILDDSVAGDAITVKARRI